MAPFISIARFVLSDTHIDDGAEFEKAFGKYRSALDTSPGMLRTVLLAGNKGEYAILTWWADQQAHKATIGDLRFFIGVSSKFLVLGKLVSVKGFLIEGSEPNVVTDPFLALTRFTLNDNANAEEFVGKFTRHAEFMRSADGFLAHQFVGSVDEDGSYFNLGWWSDRDSYVNTMRSPEFGADAKSMAGLVDVAPETYAVLSDTAAEVVPA